MTVLIVDDHAGIRRLLRLALRDVTTEIWECSDGCDALEIYKARRPDVVLMDVHMPRIGGLAATKQIRAFDEGASVIILTDDDDDALREAAIAAGAAAYLLKTDLLDLEQLIRSAISRG